MLCEILNSFFLKVSLFSDYPLLTLLVFRIFLNGTFVFKTFLRQEFLDRNRHLIQCMLDHLSTWLHLRC